MMRVEKRIKNKDEKRIKAFAFFTRLQRTQLASLGKSNGAMNRVRRLRRRDAARWLRHEKRIKAFAFFTRLRRTQLASLGKK